MSIYANGVDIDGGGTSSRSEITLATSGEANGTENAAWKTVGSRRLDPAAYPVGAWTFTAEGVVSGTTGTVRLYDATNGLTVALLEMTGIGPTDPGAVQSAEVEAPSEVVQYLVEIQVPATGSLSDSFNLTAAYIAVTG